MINRLRGYFGRSWCYNGREGTYSDRPTITYTPVIGRNYAQKLVAPLPLPAILLLIQSGYPAAYVFRVCVQNINVLDNSRSGVLDARPGDPDFFELLDLLHVLQKADGMAVRSRIVDDKETMVIIFKSPENETVASAMKKIKEHLALDKDSMEFPVVFGGNAVSDQEIAIQGRRMFQIMSEYGAGIDIPDLAFPKKSAFSVETGPGEQNPNLIRVRSEAERPDEAFGAVPYRDHWFWIEDQDVQSKTTFRFLMILFSFSERGESGPAGPVVTVPTNQAGYDLVVKYCPDKPGYADFGPACLFCLDGRALELPGNSQ